jgi:hypothetical protein
MPRLESILLHSASGDGYNDLTPLSAIRRGPGAMTGENSAEARLRGIQAIYLLSEWTASKPIKPRWRMLG